MTLVGVEMFEALVGGLLELGGVPREYRTHNLSAATLGMELASRLIWSLSSSR